MVPSTVQVKGFLDGAGLLNIPAAAWTWSPELETLPEISARRRAPPFPPLRSPSGVCLRRALRRPQPWRLESRQSLSHRHTSRCPRCPAVAEMLAVTNPQFPSYCQQKYPGELWKCLIGEYRRARKLNRNRGSRWDERDTRPTAACARSLTARPLRRFPLITSVPYFVNVPQFDMVRCDRGPSLPPPPPHA